MGERAPANFWAVFAQKTVRLEMLCRKAEDSPSLVRPRVLHGLKCSPNHAAQCRKDNSIDRHRIVAIVRSHSAEHVGLIVPTLEHEGVIEIELLGRYSFPGSWSIPIRQQLRDPWRDASPNSNAP
jgi:hypothetical protein